ncbi:phosphonate metabolism protein PhnP [Endozoicomonas sp.]|uniref:phosphonate metabolism protein PhnP n=1 Tax=Endozoicomonas sp. TaxID=1892382 RepID=UPI003AF8C335
MKFTLTGTGSVKGCPVYGCDCPACIKAIMDPFLRRSPASALLESDGELILIDAGLTDIQERFPAGTLKQVLLTHYHMDHIAGLFSLRWGSAFKISVMGPDTSDAPVELMKHPGILDFSQTTTQFSPFSINGVKVTPVPLSHSRPTFGYVFERNGRTLAYLTDTLGLPDETLTFLTSNPLNVMIIDCSYAPDMSEPPGSHNNLKDVMELHQKIEPSRTILTHIGHELDNWMNANPLPKDIEAGHDGLVITL